MGFNRKLISKTTLIENYKSGKTFDSLFDKDGITLVGNKTIKFYKVFQKKGLTHKLKKKLKKWSQKTK